MLTAFTFVTAIIRFENTMSKQKKFQVTCEEIILINNQIKRNNLDLAF